MDSTGRRRRCLASSGPSTGVADSAKTAVTSGSGLTGWNGSAGSIRMAGYLRGLSARFEQGDHAAHGVAHQQYRAVGDRLGEPVQQRGVGRHVGASAG